MTVGASHGCKESLGLLVEVGVAGLLSEVPVLHRRVGEVASVIPQAVTVHRPSVVRHDAEEWME